jgi:serine-type D-Ala-D-Ala carboxypeptidase/endopeptidase
VDIGREVQVDRIPDHALEFVMRFCPAALSAAVGALFACGTAHAMTDAELQSIVGERLHGDRTGACFAAAVIDKNTVSRAYVCADGKKAAPRIDADTAFEIGSVSKPMMAALLAGLIRDGKASLDDPLSAYLPKGSAVPTFDSKPILLRHIVTHTSGLPAIPSNVADGDPSNPYAHLDEKTLLKALSTTTLSRAPGAQFEYSNFAAMLLSYAVARRAGSDFETLLDTRVFSPLGMDSSYINRKPEGVKVAIGHTPDGKAVHAWTFPTDFAGVGGVRSTLDDMVRYVQGQFGNAPKPLDADFRMTHAPVAGDAKAPFAMHWMMAPLNGRTFLAHEGGTGGFSSFVAFDPERRFGVVILSDTALHERGGLGSLGLHLLDPKIPLGKPDTGKTVGTTGPVPTLSQQDLQAYAGEYPLMPGFALTVRADDGTLTAQATGQGAFPLAPTAKRDVFEASDFGIVIRFQRDPAGKVVALKLDQAGHTLEGQRK